ncbi:stage II sporulation protein M [Crassaminicella thermophila]|uniref:Stage II sporulation protein M n=1 Tax=Crassaminicella thermophila TaxID=2599308 RepID=A0A5C0SG41_CRATE|nr:stage II sporulation protein M [Crassaminicella thermophila]QEK12677.1 stage II sporulation protein M [Crassaminicella thermophila]
MKEDLFIEKNKIYWKELENYIHLFSKNKLSSINSNKIERFIYLFRTVSHHLAYVRTYYPESKLEKYLNSLTGNAHHYLYTVRKNPWYDFKIFILYTFPKKIHKYKLFILSSFLIFFFGMLISFYMVIQDSSNSLYFLPKKLLDAIDYNFKAKQWDYPLMSSTIMINNITVSLKAFIYGIFLGIGTFYILFVNGCILGALTGLVYLNGDLIKYASLILPHGILELSAIFIAGAAGLLLGKSLLIPGKYKRLDYMIKNSKEGIKLLLGCIILLVIAALIEGFFTPLPISSVIKLTFAAFTFFALTLYLWILKP